jgi:hypothetical protein
MLDLAKILPGTPGGGQPERKPQAQEQASKSQCKDDAKAGAV